MTRIRAAVAGDVEQVAELWTTSAGPTRLPSGATEAHRLLARDPEALLVAESDGRVIGTLIVGWDGWRCSLYRMAVRGDHRRSGVAAALVRAARERAGSVGASRLDAIVDLDNGGGIAFWESQGFERNHNNGRWNATVPSDGRDGDVTTGRRET